METSAYRDPEHIRSYVKRATRMSPSQRRAYDDYWDTYGISYAPDPETVDPGTWFSNPDRRLILEIGFGMGDATAEMAALQPETNFLGIEIHKPGVGKLLGLLSKQGSENVRIINHDAMEVMETMIPSGILDGIHLFFPDPWQKKRHHKRRFIRPRIVRLLADRLKPGGYFYMVTDWEPYAESALQVITETGVLVNQYPGFASPQEWRPTTAFERKGMLADRRIHELLFLRPPPE